MTSGSGGVAVVATQLARTDRRALSQAWYSALHLAHDAHAIAAPAVRRAVCVVPSSGSVRAKTPDQRASRSAGRPPLVRGERAPRTPVAPASERRRPVSETTARIERALSHLAVPARPSCAQTIELAEGRVRLLVRTERGRTRVVALCSDALRDHVERALARARFALAAMGR